MNNICDFAKDSISIRGVEISQLIKTCDFISIIALVLGKKESASPYPAAFLLDSLLIAWSDHGEAPPSTQNCMNAASVGATFGMSLTAALMTFGVEHVPIENVAVMLATLVNKEGDRDLMARYLKTFDRVPGFGHPVHEIDPRVKPISEISEPIFITSGKHQRALKWAEGFLPEKVHVNLAGITAAIWLDLGFSIETVALLPILGRTVGLAAHYEQALKGPKFRGTPP